jgi:hypothetical protein
MFELEARRSGAPAVPSPGVSSDDEEPPSQPRRHPIWQDVRFPRQHFQRRLVQRYRRARTAPGDLPLPRHRMPTEPGAGRQYGHLGGDRSGGTGHRPAPTALVPVQTGGGRGPGRCPDRSSSGPLSLSRGCSGRLHKHQLAGGHPASTPPPPNLNPFPPLLPHPPIPPLPPCPTTPRNRPDRRPAPEGQRLNAGRTTSCRSRPGPNE